MSRIRKRLEQYKQELKRQTQYKAGLPGSALDIVNTLLEDLEADKKEITSYLETLMDWSRNKMSDSDNPSYYDGFCDGIDRAIGILEGGIPDEDKKEADKHETD